MGVSENEILRRLGARIRELRGRRAWTLEKAAEEMEIDFRHLQRIEMGSINLTMKTLAKIASCLGVRLLLVEDVDSPASAESSAVEVTRNGLAPYVNQPPQGGNDVR
jgi:transcriptional regulator with XRE-family HTH domain